LFCPATAWSARLKGSSWLSQLPRRRRIDPVVWIIVLAVAMVLMAVIRYS